MGEARRSWVEMPGWIEDLSVWSLHGLSVSLSSCCIFRSIGDAKSYFHLKNLGVRVNGVCMFADRI